MTAGVVSVNYSSEKKFVEKIIQNQANEAVDQYFDSVNTLIATPYMNVLAQLKTTSLSNKKKWDKLVVP